MMNAKDLREQRRAEIIQAASAVSSRTGFERATIGEIACEAGLGKATVYEYFASKDEVFKAMIQDGIESHISIVSTAMDGSAHFREKVTKMLFETCRAFAVSANRFFTGMYPFPCSPEIRAVITEGENRRREIIARAITGAVDSGELKRGTDAYMLTELLNGILVTLFGAYVVRQSALPSAEHIDAIIDTLFNGIGISSACYV